MSGFFLDGRGVYYCSCSRCLASCSCQLVFYFRLPLHARIDAHLKDNKSRAHRPNILREAGSPSSLNITWPSDRDPTLCFPTLVS